MLVLFLFLAFLESCGYMARIAFVLDRIFRKFGLSGKSFIPMLVGTGCGVPGIMASRTIENERDRRMTIMTTTFIPCGAKQPFIAMTAGAIFGGSPWIARSAYFIGMAAIVVSGIMLKKTKMFSGDPAPFVMELPNYRLPSAKSVGLLLWDKAKDFIQRAFTVIFFATIIIWFLETFDAKLNVVKDSSDSLLAIIGQAISPIFKPLGFADWRVTTSLISGFTAKEAVVSTMAVLMNTSTANLGTALSGAFSTLSALSFLVFTLLYTPCVAAVATIKRELDSRIQTVGVVIMQCMVAWLCGCAVYQIGALL